jgi:hypothetical protein
LKVFRLFTFQSKRETQSSAEEQFAQRHCK